MIEQLTKTTNESMLSTIPPLTCYSLLQTHKPKQHYDKLQLTYAAMF